jgi:hypothetical protein
MRSPISPPALPSVSEAASRKLFQLGTAILVAAGAYLFYRTPLTDPLEIALGLAILVLAALPALQWARQAQPYFPAFEIFMLTGISFYAVPMLGQREEVFAFTDRNLVNAGLAVVLFQVPAVLAYFAVRGQPARNPLLTESLVPERVLHQTQIGLWLNTIYLYVASFTTLIPWEAAPIFRAIFVGLGIICSFVQARLWGAGQLRQSEKIAYAVNLALQVILTFSSLYLIGGISLLVLSLIAYVTASRRVPIVLLILVLPVIAVLHGGKAAMRDIYWRTADEPLRPTLLELPAFYQQWIELGLHPPEIRPERKRSLAENLLERAALFQMLCLTADRIPDYNPYLNGETYKDIPAQLVPRVLWPGKPSPHRSNARLAIYLGLVDEEGAEKVSIAFGLICEAYANFGFIGVAGLGLALGASFKRLTLLGLHAPQFSALGLFLILLTAWSFQVEQVLATWLISLLQATVVVVGIPLASRSLLTKN